MDKKPIECPLCRIGKYPHFSYSGSGACDHCGAVWTYDEGDTLTDDSLRRLWEKVPRWIPVGERLPPLMTEVLGWHKDDRVRAWFRHSGQPKDAPYWELWSPQDRECDDCEVDEPTHWMPMPEPPAELRS